MMAQDLCDDPLHCLLHRTHNFRREFTADIESPSLDPQHLQAMRKPAQQVRQFDSFCHTESVG